MALSRFCGLLPPAWAKSFLDESAKLMKESMSYALTLSTEWSKLGIEMSKKAEETSNAGG